MIYRLSQTGFSAVELMITLFIAFVFVMMGYQLYTVTLMDGKKSDNQAQADLYASGVMKTYVNDSVNQDYKCSSTPYNFSGNSGSSRSYSGIVDCPNPTDLPALRSIVVNGQVTGEKAVHATYFTK